MPPYVNGINMGDTLKEKDMVPLLGNEDCGPINDTMIELLIALPNVIGIFHRVGITKSR